MIEKIFSFLSHRIMALTWVGLGVCAGDTVEVVAEGEGCEG